MIRLIVCLACFAGPLGALSLCDVRDVDRIAQVLAGDWVHSGAGAFVSASDEAVRPVEGDIRIDAGGAVAWAELTGVLLPRVTPVLGDMVYDVDGVDDLLATTEVEWIADDLSDTVCGPESLPQLSAAYEVSEDLNGQLTLIPYFEDRVLAVLETEWTGEWGIAFVTVTTLMTRP